MLASILGLLIYFINKNLNKNSLISFFITIGSLYLLRDYIAARAQLVTFILFIIAIFCIEKFMQGNNKKIYGISIILISLLIANIHVAVWPFLFILFLPYIAEQFVIWIYNLKIWRKIRKKKEYTKLEDKELYKITFTKNKNIKYLLIILVISILMGIFTPTRDNPYTHLYKLMKGNTTQSINEHQPLTLIQNIEIMCVMASIVAILMFTKVKISFKNLTMLGGLILLCFMSQRQISLFVLIGNIIVTQIIVDSLKNNKKLTIQNIDKYGQSFIGTSLLFCVIITISWLNVKDKLNQKYVNEYEYPVEATKYIKEILIPKVGKDNLRLFNEYNYGSYLLLNDVPVFIDSRADLYAPEFNGVKNEDGEYEGRDIFSDFIDVSNLNYYHEVVFEKYNINYVILDRATKLNMVLCRDNNYDVEYIDDNFVIYKRNVNNEDF